MEHNCKFSMEAAAAGPLMSPLWVKELYISSLSSADVRKHLRAFLDLTLQKLQAKALDLDSAFTEDRKKANHQNPDRVQCKTCNWWHTPTRGETCKCPPKAKPPHHYKPRVQAAEVADHPPTGEDSEQEEEPTWHTAPGPAWQPADTTHREEDFF